MAVGMASAPRPAAGAGSASPHAAASRSYGGSLSRIAGAGQTRVINGRKVLQSPTVALTRPARTWYTIPKGPPAMSADVLVFAAIGFAAQMVDGAISMAYGLTATS